VRYADFLRQRYRAILGYTGLLSLIASLLILSPLALLIVYRQELASAWGFLLPGLVLGLPSLYVWRRLTPRPAESLTMPEGAVIVVLTWLLATLAGAIPFMFSGMGFTHALFESTSGWTTAGLSVLDVGQASPLLLFYRSVTQLAGGAGLAILMLSTLTGPLGPGLAVVEGRQEQLLPHVRRSARLVLTLYAGYNVAGILALRLAGMTWFDAINHAFSALSTGGFSTQAQSIAYWRNPVIEGVIIVLMLLGMLNFLTAYTFLRTKFRATARNSEVRQSAILIVLGVVVLFFGVTGGLYATTGEGLRVAIFNAVSALSTTGFATVDFGRWNGLGWLVLILFMLIGGGAGSTAGGIKQYRIHVLSKGLLWEFRRRLLPRRAVTEPDVWQGEQRLFISDMQLRQVSMFVFLYVAVFVAGSGIIAAYGYPMQDSLFEFASALSTVGISVGITTADAPAGVLWVEMLAMFLGRLEFFTIVIGVLKLIDDGSDILSASLKSRSAEASVARADVGMGGYSGSQHQAAAALAQEQDQPGLQQQGEGNATSAQTGRVGDEMATGPEP
jgi:trk system potassium uptake protein TrkH